MKKFAMLLILATTFAGAVSQACMTVNNEQICAGARVYHRDASNGLGIVKAINPATAKVTVSYVVVKPDGIRAQNQLMEWDAKALLFEFNVGPHGLKLGADVYPEGWTAKGVVKAFSPDGHTVKVYSDRTGTFFNVDMCKIARTDACLVIR